MLRLDNSVTPLITSLPAWRETHRAETSPLFRHLKSLSREFMKYWPMCHCSSAISTQKTSVQRENAAVLVMLSIVPFTASRATSAVPPCFITTTHMSSNFGAMAPSFDGTQLSETCIPGVSPCGKGDDSLASWRKGLACINVLILHCIEKFSWIALFHNKSKGGVGFSEGP